MFLANKRKINNLISQIMKIAIESRNQADQHSFLERNINKK